MEHKITIKEIAKLADVSPGTVDRVIHGRGKVAEDKKIRIEKVLEEVGYKPNLMLSSISIKKNYRIAITTPAVIDGEYWAQIHKGINKALKDYKNISIKCEYFYYNQFDLFSCRSTFDELLQTKPDAVIIGPTFRDETIILTNHLEDEKIPYVFVDSMIEGSSPIAFFSANQNICGYLMAKMLYQITPKGSDYVIFQAQRIGDESANNTVLRKKGFVDFFRERGLESKVKRMLFSVSDIEENHKVIEAYIKDNPKTFGCAVLSSRGNIIADALENINNDEIKLVCLDLTDKNIVSLNQNKIDYLVCQQPLQQGFMAIKSLLTFLIYGQSIDAENYMPLDIITKENLPFYKGY